MDDFVYVYYVQSYCTIVASLSIKNNYSTKNINGLPLLVPFIPNSLQTTRASALSQPLSQTPVHIGWPIPERQTSMRPLLSPLILTWSTV